MPRLAKELSALEVKRLKHPGRGHNACLPVGGVAGLYLQITPTGGRTWLLRVVVGDRRREIGLGGYPEVPLAQARERAREAKDAIRRGIDPVEERKAARAALMTAQRRGLSFADAADRFLDAKLSEFRNVKHAAQWRSTLTTYALPQLGHMLVSDIKVQDVLRAVQPIWHDKTETAKRVRGRIEAVLSWATVAGHRQGDNPARWKGNLDSLLPKPDRVTRKENWPALAIDDAAAWFGHLRQRDGISARALEFLALTAARSGEVRGATWAEVDLEAGLWTVPAQRMKMEREHRVPLTAEAVALLRALPRMEGNPLVFPAPRGGPLSDMSLSAVMRRMQKDEEKASRPGWLDPRSARPAVPHGLRSTFRDWAAERTHYPREMAEIALAQEVGSEVERAYRRGDMMEKRRDLMAAWAGFLTQSKQELET
ncbi:integrase [Limimaricola variabilis]|uniref:Integrase n=1 Tax=Limimaricola variabilis TaxID=1492771 RepID=A0ABR6HQI8_9RHOB|nr:integrase arm-type DNA-binding domain-containing protein [Limimaricola variabilis]MBB3712815.1 integrase [Limimaricola variabilis]